ncbi:MAG: signal peptidase I [Lachnospiraceae bacterium]|nr:signal peptidase I [Lachnospiraceae bacterium]
MKFSPRYMRDYFAQGRIRSVFAWIIEIILVIMLAVGAAFLFCQCYTVQEGSMEPTLKAGDKVLINVAAYKISDPKRGDLVVFKSSTDTKSSLHAKRVIGLPGETIQIKDGQILINGETYVEQKDFPSITNPGLAEEPITLDSDEYFLLGDNRNNSEDSRHADVGCVTKSSIVGKLWLSILPFNRFGFVKS